MSANNIMNFDPESQEKNDKSISIKSTCCLLCSTAFIVVCIVCAYVVWAVFSIKALVHTSNEEITDKCSKSDIWICLLVIVIISALQVFTNNTSSENKEKDAMKIEQSIHYDLYAKIVLNIALVIWVGIELFEPCAQDKLQDTSVYVTLKIWFYASIIGVSLGILMSCCCSCTYNAYQANNKQ